VHKRLILIAAGLAISAAAMLPASGCRHKGPALPGETPVDPKSATRPEIAPAGKPATTASTTPSTAAASSIGTFSSPKLGIRLQYPADWKPTESKDYELLLVPAKKPAAGDADRSISLDVPDLPPHIPGMIPIGLVKNGYLDDLKKQYGAIETREEAMTVAGAEGRLLISHWKKDGRSFSDIAVVVVHANRVYILRAAGDQAGEPAIRAVFDGIAKSVQWVK
jgi:hypothetical protein